MKSKYIKATPGWGTGKIDSEVNYWLEDKEIEIINIKYETHIEERTDFHGVTKDAIVYTVLIIYND